MKTYRVFVQIECEDSEADEEYSKVVDECVFTTAEWSRATDLSESLVEAAGAYTDALEEKARWDALTIEQREAELAELRKDGD